MTLPNQQFIHITRGKQIDKNLVIGNAIGVFHLSTEYTITTKLIYYY
jgi:hypothetical protein